MAERSEIFPDRYLPTEPRSAPVQRSLTPHGRNLGEIGLVFTLILLAVWTPPGPVNVLLMMATAACVIACAMTGNWGLSEIGLKRPLAGTGYMLLIGTLFAGIIALIGIPLKHAGPGYSVPWSVSWLYGVWSLQQEFILQSIFFLRLEAVLGSRRAVVAAAFLFAVVHIPSPVLTVFSLLGGLLFCELFRRWRNLFPLGVIHAALGLTVAASLPDKWLHHMRVGIGYLTIR
jgi:hypothetical protein